MMRNINNPARAMQQGAPMAIPTIDPVLNFDPDAAVDKLVD